VLRVTIPPLLFRLFRSGAAGTAATVADMGSLWLLVSRFGMDASTARAPALVFGSVVMFLGNKYFVFHEPSSKTLLRETLLFALVQAIGIKLTVVAYAASLALSPLFQQHYVLVGLVVNNLIWLGYFFPAWHLVFRKPPKREVAPQAEPVV
jgi:putative flippase GtrA